MVDHELDFGLENSSLMDDLLDEILLDSYEVVFPCKDMNQIDSAEGTDSSAVPTKTRPKQKLGIKFLPNLAILDKGWAGATRGLPRETAIRWLALGLLGALLLNVVRHRAAAGLRALNSSSDGPTDDDLEERRKRREDALTIRHVKTKYADMNARMHKKYQA